MLRTNKNETKQKTHGFLVQLHTANNFLIRSRLYSLYVWEEKNQQAGAGINRIYTHVQPNPPSPTHPQKNSTLFQVLLPGPFSTFSISTLWKTKSSVTLRWLAFKCKTRQSILYLLLVHTRDTHSILRMIFPMDVTTIQHLTYGGQEQ